MSETNENPGTETTEEQTPQPGSGGSGRLTGLLAIVLVIAAAAGAYHWVTAIHDAEHVALESRVQDLADGSLRDAETTGGRIEGLEAALGEQAGALDGLDGELGSLRQAQADLQDSVKALYAKDAQASLEWVLAEAEYLVLAATQRLALVRDARTAAAALRAADDRIRSAKHPDLIELRDQLTRDIAALVAIDEPDIEGLALYLAQASAGVDELPTRPIAELEAPFTQLGEERMQADNLGGLARALWADLKSLVEVKDGELSDGVLFDPKLRYFLRQNLRLELASARMAVLARDNDNFRAAVQLIADLLDAYYDADNGAVKALRERLDATAALDLEPAVPNISGSLDMIRALRDALAERAGAPVS